MKVRQWMVLSLLAVVMIGSSCKKAAEQQAEDIVKKLMVDGTWRVTKFMEGTTDNTANFNTWIFKFNDDNTVTATLGSSSQTGAWQSNFSSQTISAQFAPAVGDPLQKLNGTWNIVTTSATKGGFSQTKNSMNYSMELTKN